MSAPPAATHAEASPHHWKSFTPGERMMRSMFYVVVLLAIVWSLKSIEIIPEFLAPADRRFVRPHVADRLGLVSEGAALIETLHTATLGTVLAVALASLVSLLVARNIIRSVVLNTIGRFILVATRSLRARTWRRRTTPRSSHAPIEEAKPGPIETLTATGAAPLAILLKGYCPPGEARLPRNRGVSLGHQRARIRRARSRRRRRTRHGARYRPLSRII